MKGHVNDPPIDPGETSQIISTLTAHKGCVFKLRPQRVQN